MYKIISTNGKLYNVYYIYYAWLKFCFFFIGAITCGKSIYYRGFTSMSPLACQAQLNFNNFNTVFCIDMLPFFCTIHGVFVLFFFQLITCQNRFNTFLLCPNSYTTYNPNM